MKISELSQITGVSPRMLRYFEQQGLLVPDRKDNDYRFYSTKHREQVIQIREWQRLGLTLNEIKKLSEKPEQSEHIIKGVFERERALFLEKQKALFDLRERLTGKKNPYYEHRTAYSIPNLESVLNSMKTQGWEATIVEYSRFSEWREAIESQMFMIGEMIHQSAFYLLAASAITPKEVLEKLMGSFCRNANKYWHPFDGHPPQIIEGEDLGEFYAPNDIVVHLVFSNKTHSPLSILLPYQALFSLAKATDESS